MDNHRLCLDDVDLYQFEQSFSPECGIPVYARRLDLGGKRGSVAIRVLITVGARQDPDGREGLAHFAEHTPFQGTHLYPAHEDIQLVNEDVFLGTLNASTDFESTQFYGVTSTEDLPDAMKVFRDLVFFPLLTPDAFTKEQDVVVREIWRAFGTTGNAEFTKEHRRDLYGIHSFGRAGVLGWEASVRAISPELFRDFMERYWHVGNVYVFFVGDVTLDVAERMTDLFGRGAPQKVALAKPPFLEKGLSPQRLFRETSAAAIGFSGLQSAIINAESVMPVQENPYVADVGNRMLNQILIDAVRQKLGGTYQVSVSCQTALDHHLWSLRLECPGDILEIVCAIIKETFYGVSCGNDPCISAFSREKRIRERGQDLRSDVSFATIARNAAFEKSVYGRIITDQEGHESLARVTYDDVARMVREEFSEHKLCWSIVRP